MTEEEKKEAERLRKRDTTRRSRARKKAETIGGVGPELLIHSRSNLSKEELKKIKAEEQKRWRQNLTGEQLEAFKQKERERSRARREQQYEYRKNNPERIKKLRNAYYMRIRACPIKLHDFRERNRLYNIKKRKTDPQVIARLTLRSSLRNKLEAYNNGWKTHSAKELLGCTIGEFVVYIQNQFKDGMTWQNHGLYTWHLDHIRPCASFDLTDIEQQKLCFHYTNFQPLTAKDNIIKGAKYE